MGFFDWFRGGARREDWVAAVFEQTIGTTQLEKELPASYKEVKRELRTSFQSGFDAVGTSPASLPSTKDLNRTIDAVENIDKLIKQLLAERLKTDLRSIVTRYMEVFYRLGNLLGTFNYLKNTHAFTDAELKQWRAYFERIGVFDIMKSTLPEFLSVSRPIEEHRAKKSQRAA